MTKYFILKMHKGPDPQADEQIGFFETRIDAEAAMIELRRMDVTNYYSFRIGRIDETSDQTTTVGGNPDTAACEQP